MNALPLRKLIPRVIAIEPSSSPLISCFVDLDPPRADSIAEIEAAAQLASKRLTNSRRSDFIDAYGEIQDYLQHSLQPGSRSLAVYSRWGDDPVFLPVQFQVPLRTQFIVDQLPHIYPLIELKDTYHRFVIVITTESEARILETTFGSITEEVLAARPDLRRRIGREWTREHYQNHKREREQQFIREKIRIIDELMSRSGHNHLVIAGSPKMASRLAKALPPRLRARLIDTLEVNPRNGLDPILLESVRLVAAEEDRESHDRVRQLESAVLGSGLGVAGFHACVDALEGGYADLLIIDQEYAEDELREELVRLATRASVGIETVGESDTLQRLAGVGCLLRYRPDLAHAGTGNNPCAA